MIIGILQPMYLPWAGYFEQIAAVDRFVLMDDVQYTKRDWRNRNRIKTAAGPLWLSVPIKRPSLDTPIAAIEIDYGRDWVEKHLRTIEVNYRRRRFFEPLFTEIASVLQRRYVGLSELNRELMLVVMAQLRISTPIFLSSAVPRGDVHATGDERRNQRILQICRHFDASVLYDGKRAASFIDVAMFDAAGVKVIFQDYTPTPYPQAFGAFVSHLSVIDLIMNTGPDAAEILRSPATTSPLRRRRERNASAATP